MAAAFQDRWSAAITRLGLEVDSTLSVAKAVLDVWQAIPAKLLAIEKDSKRVAGMQRNVDAFEREVERLSAEMCPELPALAPLDQARRLSTLVESAMREQSLFDSAGTRLKEAEAAALEARVTAERSGNALQHFLEEQGLTGQADEVLDRLNEAGQARIRVRKAENALGEASNHAEKDQLRFELQNFDADDARSVLTKLEDHAKSEEDAVEDAVQTRVNAEKAMADFEAGTGAELPYHAMQVSGLEMQEAAIEYVRLRLGSAMLDRLIERYRTSEADPLLKSASRFFQTAHRRLVQQYRPGVRFR